MQHVKLIALGDIAPLRVKQNSSLSGSALTSPHHSTRINGLLYFHFICNWQGICNPSYLAGNDSRVTCTCLQIFLLRCSRWSVCSLVSYFPNATWQLSCGQPPYSGTGQPVNFLSFLCIYFTSGWLFNWGHVLSGWNTPFRYISMRCNINVHLWSNALLPNGGSGSAS